MEDNLRLCGSQPLSDVYLLRFMRVCVLRCMLERPLHVVYVCGCVNVLIQWCEAAGLWLSVEQHSQRRRNYTQFKCRFGHLAKLVQNGATMVGPPALNCTRVLLQALIFLRTKCNMC